MNKAINEIAPLEICPQFISASKYLDGIYNNLTFNDSAQSLLLKLLDCRL